jgi:heme-degrading monooxygenase HmoA
MVTGYVRHKVADFKKWKVVYDEHDATRKQYGCKKSEVFTNAQDPNEVLVITEWDSKEAAAKFDESANLKEAMQHAGVVSVPVFSFAE